MEVKVRKIATLSEEEKTILMTAGKLLGTIRDSFESGEITELSEEDKSLITAILNVATTVINK